MFVKVNWFNCTDSSDSLQQSECSCSSPSLFSQTFLLSSLHGSVWLLLCSSVCQLRVALWSLFNQSPEYKPRRAVCAVRFDQTWGKLHCSAVCSACFRNFSLPRSLCSLFFSPAQLSRVILPLTDSVQSQQLCFEKALVMSGQDHVHIHLFPACRTANPLFPCLSCVFSSRAV